MFHIWIHIYFYLKESSCLPSPRHRPLAPTLPPPHSILLSRQVGLSICVDLRFPEMYRALCDQGARVLAVPSAFTVMTGQAHWKVPAKIFPSFLIDTHPMLLSTHLIYLNLS
jgi:hypothetical protein